MNADLLDEFAAWCEIAMLCEGPLSRGDYGFLLDPEDPEEVLHKSANGLCWMIRFWETGTADALSRRKGAHSTKAREDRGYWWDHNREGWDERAAFAWSMAEECEKEMQG